MGVRTANVQPGNIGETLEKLAATIHGRREASPETSYTAKLLTEVEDELLKKLAEESSDHDRDGYTAGEEYVADTDPCDAGSRFMIRAIDPSPPALRLGVPSAAGRLYTVERREAPGGGDWRPVPPWIDVPGTGAMLWLPATNGLPAGFFRARVRLAD